MTVAELIEYLQEQDQTLEVKFYYNSGDYWRTHVAKDIDSIEVGHVVHSDYHRMDKVVDSEDPEETEYALEVLLLS
jgi:hypothetical protein